MLKKRSLLFYRASKFMGVGLIVFNMILLYAFLEFLIWGNDLSQVVSCLVDESS